MTDQMKDLKTARIQDKVKVKGEQEIAPETEGGMDQNVEVITQMIHARLQAALQEHLASPEPQIAEPLDWWDIYALGPVQPGASMAPPASFAGPLLPNQVIRMREYAYVATIILLNPSFPSPGVSAAELLSRFALPYEVEYATGELKRWQPAPAYLQHVSSGTLSPGVYWAVDVFPFIAQDEGVFEMTITARIFGCDRTIAPPFAGYATLVQDIDRDMFGFGPRLQQDQSVRFQVYR